MSSPARDARLLAIARGFTQVIGRGNAHIITKNPTTGKCCFDAQVGGGWHYNGDQETDTAWVAGVAPWNWQMTKALYNLYALSRFNNGQIIKCVDPASGQYVAFQPMALQWTNALNQIQQISMPQSVVAQANDDILYWPSAYGSGRHFRYQASPLRLNKQLIIDSAASLPVTTYDTLELNFIMAMSSGVTAYIDSGSGLAAWDKKTRKDTVKAIEFRLSGGAVVWSFAVPTAYDSAGGFTTGVMRLKKSGSRLYVSVRFPKAWIDSVPSNVWPIYIDPTVDYQVGSNADDGFWSESAFYNDPYEIQIGSTESSVRTSFFRFAVTIPVGATIDSAKLSFYGKGGTGTPAAGNLYFEDAANPAQITSISDGNSRTKTTAYSAETPVNVYNEWWDTGDIGSVVQELQDSYSFASGAAMQVIWVGPALDGRYQFVKVVDYGQSSSNCAKFQVIYTEAASGSSWAGTWGG